MNIGIDIIEIRRIENLINRFGVKKLKFLNDDELYAKRPESIAGIFASKEAFSKALGYGIGKNFSFKDISVLKDKRGKPYIKIHSSSIKIKNCDISISHDGGFAIAAVIVEI